jgi:hypothetical protein
VPLSEEELRQLEQLERALAEDDPKLASTLRGTPFRRAERRRAIIAGVAFLAGVGLLMTGAVSQQLVVGIIGFVVMLAAAMVVITAFRQPSAPSAPPAFDESAGGFSVIDGGRQGRPSRASRHPRAGRASHSSSFMTRMEERWRRRRDGF